MSEKKSMEDTKTSANQSDAQATSGPLCGHEHESGLVCVKAARPMHTEHAGSADGKQLMWYRRDGVVFSAETGRLAFEAPADKFRISGAEVWTRGQFARPRPAIDEDDLRTYQAVVAMEPSAIAEQAQPFSVEPVPLFSVPPDELNDGLVESAHGQDKRIGGLWSALRIVTSATSAEGGPVDVNDTYAPGPIAITVRIDEKHTVEFIAAERWKPSEEGQDFQCERASYATEASALATSEGDGKAYPRLRILSKNYEAGQGPIDIDGTHVDAPTSLYVSVEGAYAVEYVPAEKWVDACENPKRTAIYATDAHVLVDEDAGVLGIGPAMTAMGANDALNWAIDQLEQVETPRSYLLAVELEDKIAVRAYGEPDAVLPLFQAIKFAIKSGKLKAEPRREGQKPSLANRVEVDREAVAAKASANRSKKVRRGVHFAEEKKQAANEGEREHDKTRGGHLWAETTREQRAAASRQGSSLPWVVQWVVQWARQNAICQTLFLTIALELMARVIERGRGLTRSEKSHPLCGGSHVMRMILATRDEAYSIGTDAAEGGGRALWPNEPAEAAEEAWERARRAAIAGARALLEGLLVELNAPEPYAFRDVWFAAPVAVPRWQVKGLGVAEDYYGFAMEQLVEAAIFGELADGGAITAACGLTDEAFRETPIYKGIAASFGQNLRTLHELVIERARHDARRDW